jgi:hypothetical protein
MLSQCFGSYINTLGYIKYETQETENAVYCKEKEKWYIEIFGVNFVSFFDDFGSYSKYVEAENIYTMDYTTNQYKATGVKILDEKNNSVINFLKVIPLHLGQCSHNNCRIVFDKCYCSLSAFIKVNGIVTKSALVQKCEEYGKVEKIFFEKKECKMVSIRKQFLNDKLCIYKIVEMDNGQGSVRKPVKPSQFIKKFKK